MGDLWAQVPLAPFGAGALFLGLCWWITRRIVRGDLVPRQHLLDVQQSHATQQQITLEQGMTLEKLTAVTEKLLANDEAILHVVREIQRAAGGDGT